MTELFEYILIALACLLVLPFIEPQESEDKEWCPDCGAKMIEQKEVINNVPG